MAETLLIFLFPMTFTLAGLYVMFLHRFGRSLRSKNPDAWKQFSANLKIPRATIQVTYLALQESKNGLLCGERLAADVMKDRGRAVVFLYSGMLSFLALLSGIIFS